LSRRVSRAEYSPQLDRNLRTRLVNRFRDKYRFMGGEEIIKFIVDDILGLVEQEYRLMDVMRKGQILWDGVAIKQRRKPGRALNMKETRTKPIVLSLITEEDIRKLKDGGSFKELRKDVLERITREAHPAADQGSDPRSRSWSDAQEGYREDAEGKVLRARGEQEDEPLDGGGRAVPP
jgi:hypothetical protein